MTKTWCDKCNKYTYQTSGGCTECRITTAYENVLSTKVETTIKPKKIGVYAGSFNPYHIGHEDIYNQASKVFDEVILAQGINSSKNVPDFLDFKDNRQVWRYDSLLSNLFKNDKLDNVEKFLIRGLRNSFDVGYEDNLRNTLLDFNPDIKVIYFFCHKQFEHVSSSMIRSLYPFGEETYKRYLI